MGCRDIVTLSNVKEAGSTVSEQEEAVNCAEKKEAKSRKKTKKRKREEEYDNEDINMVRAVFAGLETQRKDMKTFMNNFSRIHEQQLTAMNALVGTPGRFLEKQ